MPRDIRGRAGAGRYGRLQRRLAVVSAYDLVAPPALAVPPFEHGTRGRARSAEASWSRSTGCRSPSRSTSPASPAATVTAPMWLFERQLLYCRGPADAGPLLRHLAAAPPSSGGATRCHRRRAIPPP